MAPVLIFDLDGTVLSVNSFPHWAAFLLRGRLPHLARGRRVGVQVAALSLLLRRKLGLMPHEELKWRLQRLWQGAVAGDGGASERALQRRLLAHVRPGLRGVLDGVAAGRVDAVLATAAAADYAEGLGRALGFRHVLATAAGRDRPGVSNVGAAKRDAVLAFLSAQGWDGRPRVLFTDHRDDLPLIEVCGETYWYGPASRLEQARAAAPAARIAGASPTGAPAQWTIPERSGAPC